MATIARRACTTRPSASTVTRPFFWRIDFTGTPSSTRLPSALAIRIEISCVPPSSRLSCAPPAVLMSRRRLPGFFSLPAAAM